MVENWKMDNYIIDSMSFNSLENAFIYLLKNINPNLKDENITEYLEKIMDLYENSGMDFQDFINKPNLGYDIF